MAKVTSKLQVTIPKAIADRYAIRPGDSILFQEAGDVIRVLPPDAGPPAKLDRRQKLALFDAATRRQRARDRRSQHSPSQTRGWTREELYRRGSAA